MKRVVTGHDAHGRSVVLFEDQPKPVVLEKAGDVLVQRGTSHAWSNRTSEPALIAFVLIDAAR